MWQGPGDIKGQCLSNKGSSPKKICVVLCNVIFSIKIEEGEGCLKYLDDFKLKKS